MLSNRVNKEPNQNNDYKVTITWKDEHKCFYLIGYIRVNNYLPSNTWTWEQDGAALPFTDYNQVLNMLQNFETFKQAK